MKNIIEIMFRKSIKVGEWQVIEFYQDYTFKISHFHNKENAVAWFEQLKRENPNAEVWPKDSLN